MLDEELNLPYDESQPLLKYACYFNNGGCIILNGTDNEDVAWLAVAHARLEGTKLRDCFLIPE